MSYEVTRIRQYPVRVLSAIERREARAVRVTGLAYPAAVVAATGG